MSNTYTHKGLPVKDITRTEDNGECIGYPEFQTEDGKIVYWTDPPVSEKGEDMHPLYGIAAIAVFVVCAVLCVMTI